MAQTKLSRAKSELEAARKRLEEDPHATTKEVEDKKADLSLAWLTRAFWVSSVMLAVLLTAAILTATTFTHAACHFSDAAHQVCEGRPWSPARKGLLWGASVTFLSLMALGFLGPGKRQGGIAGYLVGTDNRVSTSKTHVGLWTIAIVFSFFFFTIQLWATSNLEAFNESIVKFGPSYLLLLGGPFAAAVLAKANTSSQVDDGKVQQVQGDQPKATDVTTHDDGKPAITDAQFFLFNLTALAYFAVALARQPSVLPTVPNTLVALTSLSALTYLGAKVATTNPPSITNVLILESPSDGFIYPGQRIKIFGNGFVDSSASTVEHQKAVRVSLGNVEVTPLGVFTDSEITAVVPRGLGGDEGGNVEIRVTTSSGAVTSAYTGIKVKAIKILSATRNGLTVTITGYGFVVPQPDGFVPPTATVERAGVQVGIQPPPTVTAEGLTLNLIQDPNGPVQVTITLDGFSATATTSS